MEEVTRDRIGLTGSMPIPRSSKKNKQQQKEIPKFIPFSGKRLISKGLS